MTMTIKPRLSHLTPQGGARMVDVGAKPVTRRSATAEASVAVGPQVAALIRRKGGLAKGQVLQTAQLAAIMAAKETPRLIPMCHPIDLDHIEAQVTLNGDCVRVVTRVSGRARTGVEMEAMVAAAVGALTVYDMVKSAGKGIEIGPLRLLKKTGGKSGRYSRAKR